MVPRKGKADAAAAIVVCAVATAAAAAGDESGGMRLDDAVAREVGACKAGRTMGCLLKFSEAGGAMMEAREGRSVLGEDSFVTEHDSPESGDDSEEETRVLDEEGEDVSFVREDDSKEEDASEDDSLVSGCLSEDGSLVSEEDVFLVCKDDGSPVSE